MLTIISLQGCGYSERAVQVAIENDFKVHVIQVARNSQEYEQYNEKFRVQPTYPKIVCGNTVIGGCDEFVEIVNKMKELSAKNNKIDKFCKFLDKKIKSNPDNKSILEIASYFKVR